MEVKQSEFARMCGVSALAISLQIRKGNLIKNENGKISTEEKSNKNYLSKHLKKAYIQKQESLATNEGEFDIFEGLEQNNELGTAVFTQQGREAVAACKSIIKYIEQQEMQLAMQQKVISKPIEPCALHFLQSLAEKIVETQSINNAFTHDGMILTLNEEYRIPYMQAIKECEKKRLT